MVRHSPCPPPPPNLRESPNESKPLMLGLDCKRLPSTGTLSYFVFNSVKCLLPESQDNLHTGNIQELSWNARGSSDNACPESLLTSPAVITALGLCFKCAVFISPQPGRFRSLEGQFPSHLVAAAQYVPPGEARLEMVSS